MSHRLNSFGLLVPHRNSSFVVKCGTLDDDDSFLFSQVDRLFPAFIFFRPPFRSRYPEIAFTRTYYAARGASGYAIISLHLFTVFFFVLFLLKQTVLIRDSKRDISRTNSFFSARLFY